MTKHHTAEEMRALADRLQDATRSTYYASGMNAAAAMLRDIADADDTTCSDPVAYCDPFDGTNSTAFAWPGKSRDLSRHTLPLYKRPMPRDDTDEKDREDAERWRFFSIHDVSWDADENGVYLWVGHAKAIKGATLEDAIDAAIFASKVKP